MGVIVVLLPFLDELATGASHLPRLLPWPVWDALAQFALTALMFGYLFGEGTWRKNESEFRRWPKT